MPYLLLCQGACAARRDQGVQTGRCASRLSVHARAEDRSCCERSSDRPMAAARARSRRLVHSFESGVFSKSEGTLALARPRTRPLAGTDPRLCASSSRDHRRAWRSTVRPRAGASFWSRGLVVRRTRRHALPLGVGALLRIGSVLEVADVSRGSACCTTGRGARASNRYAGTARASAKHRGASLAASAGNRAARSGTRSLVLRLVRDRS
jgi:hypothetical protein